MARAPGRQREAERLAIAPISVEEHVPAEQVARVPVIDAEDPWPFLFKVCSRCGERKLKNGFPPSKGRHAGGRLAWCRQCTRDYAWRRRLAMKLGVSIDLMNAYLERAARHERGEC